MLFTRNQRDVECTARPARMAGQSTRTRETREPEPLREKTHVYLPDYRHGGVYWVVTGKSCAAARGRVRGIGNFSTGKPENIDEINFVWTQLVKNRLKGGARSFDE
jgi:hypothetical protein